MRSLGDDKKVGHLRTLCPDAAFPIELVEADLLTPASWEPAVKGCSFILHVASPFPSKIPKDREILLKPALEGTLNVLRAVAADPARTVKRVVLTSSVAAIFSGRDQDEKTWGEGDWAILDDTSRPVNPYPASKALAERAAWDFVAALPADRAFELAVICPGLISGPVLGGVPGTAAETVERLLKRQMPGLPDMIFPGVDVRDAARAHILAMRAPGAAGRRFVCAPFDFALREVAQLLRDELAPAGYRVTTVRLPLWLLRCVGLVDSSLRAVLPHIGLRPRFDHAPAEALLGISAWRGQREAVLDQAYSLIALGLVPDMSPGRALTAPGPAGPCAARERSRMDEGRARLAGSPTPV